MSEDSPRWPGADGSPGIDFSPRPRAGTGDDANPAESAVPDAPTEGSSSDAVNSSATPTRPASAESAASVSSAAPAPAADATEIRAKEAPRPQETAASWAWQPMDDLPDNRSARSAGSAASAEDVGAIAGGAARAAESSRRVAAASGTAVGAGASASKASPTSRRTGSRRTRKARLRLSRIDPWSVMKTTFLFSIAFGIMMMVIAWVLWTVLAGSGAIESLNQFMTTLIGDQDGGRFDIETWINGPRVLGFAALLAAIDVVILTAVATLFAFLYNLAATVIGGLEVTLAED